jgi:MFS family permease
VSKKHLNIKDQFVLNILYFSLNLQYASLVPVVIPTMILLFVGMGHTSQVGNVQQGTLLGWLVTVASVVSLLMPPLVGELSDRTELKLGRRRPYIIIGAILWACSTPFLVVSSSIGIFLVGLAILHVGNNILAPAYQSLVPDKVPNKERGKTSGFVGALTILGTAVGLGLAALLLGSTSQRSHDPALIRHNAGIFFIVTAAALIVGAVITVIGVHEKQYHYVPDPQVVQDRKSGERRLVKFGHWFERNWVEPWHAYNFRVVFFTRASIMMGLAMFMTYIEYYFAQVQHISNFVQETALIAVLALGGGVVSGVVFGILSDRLKRRAPVVCGATICMAVASFAFVVFPSTFSIWLWPLGALFGLGQGAFTSVDWALSIDALPSSKEVGKDLGIWDASNNLPAILGPLVGSVILLIMSHFGNLVLGYRIIFLVASIFLVVAAICVLFVHEGQIRKQQEQSDKTVEQEQQQQQKSHLQT